MSRKPEAVFRRSVHKYLAEGVYYQSIDGTATAGTPDSYYEKLRFSAWVEWKYTRSKVPREFRRLTDLQKDWMSRAWENQQLVGVIIGCPNGGYVCKDMGDYELNKFEGPFKRAYVAEWIFMQLLNRRAK